jgi:hypothetical protein
MDFTSVVILDPMGAVLLVEGGRVRFSWAKVVERHNILKGSVFRL